MIAALLAATLNIDSGRPASLPHSMPNDSARVERLGFFEQEETTYL